MKKQLLIFVLLILFSLPAGAQSIPNGGMENWDTSFAPIYPASWLTNAFYASLPCAPVVYSAEKTNDRHTGNCAAKLEAQTCMDDLGHLQVYMGYLACGSVTTLTQLFSGIYYHERPAALSFYYKFQRMGTDTGYVRISLLTLDTTGQPDQLIGEGKFMMLNNITTYTPCTVPINYFSNARPDVLQVVFATSKTCADRDGVFCAEPGNGTNAGTTIWVDDITVSGGSLSVSNNTPHNNFKIFPNPVSQNETLHITGNDDQQVFDVELYTIDGKLVYTGHSYNVRIDIQGSRLPAGLLFYSVKQNKAVIARGKVIMQ